MFDNEIVQEYSSEARELLEEMDGSLIRLEQGGRSPELLNNIFRAVHCIKGSAEYIGLERSSTLTHGVESLLDRLREGEIEIGPQIIDFLFRVKDLVGALVEEVASEREEKTDIIAMMEELGTYLPHAPAPPARIPLEAPFEAFTEPERADEAFPEPAAGESDLVPELDTLLEPRAVSEFEPAPEAEHELIPGYQTTTETDLIGDLEVEAPTEEFRGVTEQDKTPEQMLAEGIAEALEPLEETVLSEAEEETTTAEELIAGTTLEETVPHVLNVSLLLDDLEDGLSFDTVAPAMLETIRNLDKSLDYIGLSSAVDTLKEMENRIRAYAAGSPGRLPSEQIRSLRSLLHNLQDYYPPETFPAEEPTLPEPEPSPIKEIDEVKRTLAKELSRVPLINESVIDAVYAAGYRSLDELSRLDPKSISSLTGVSAEVAYNILKAGGAITTEVTTTRRRRQKLAETKSLMADVDDELLDEFEGIFGDSIVLEETAIPAPARPEPPPPRGHLLGDLDLVAEETDKEIVEIFLTYGREILDKLRPHLDKIRRGTIGTDDLEECAEWIKSIRSSSTYMDYQALATLLDDWYERTLWVAHNIDEPSREDLEFMEENSRSLRGFFDRLQKRLKPPVVEAPRLISAAEQALRETVAAARAAQELPEPTLEMEDVSGAPTREQLVGTETVTAAPGRKPPPEPAISEEPTHEPFVPRYAAVEEPALPMSEMLAGAPAAVDSAPESPVVRTMRVDAVKVDTLLNQVGELVVNRSYVEQLSAELKELQRQLAAAREVGKREIQSIKNVTLKITEASISLGRVATDLQEGVMKLRMLPIGQLFNRMPRLIRDLSRRVGKSVTLEVHGGETEVDKRVIEQIYNPLVHIIRNAVDHGIEPRETRSRLGKPAEGSIRLNAYSQGNQVIIDVEDDGRGIDTDLVLRKAVQMGLVDAQEGRSLATQEAYNFLFVPGFSTSDKVTRTSGRGVGMDVVKKDVEKINGQVDIASWKDRGTRISIKIPLTLAIIQTLLIRAATHHFAIPLVSVREIIQTSLSEISTIEGVEVIKFREETIPILRLKETFNLGGDEELPDPAYVVLTATGPNSVGLLVQDLVGEQDVVIKPLAEHVFKSRGLAGSTILGDGTIALVMDVAELIDHMASRQRQLRQRLLQRARRSR